MAALMTWLLLAATTTPDGGAGGPGGPNDALRAALADAESNEPARHDHLLDELQTRRFLEALDTPQDYAQASRLRLHVDQVAQALAKNPGPRAQHAFLALTVNRVFLAHDERVIALLLASVNVRPAPPALVKFWDRHSRPNDGFTPTTIAVLVENGSAPALALLEQKLAGRSHSNDDKIAWMRGDILGHRNDLALLQSCERLLRGKLRKDLRPLLVEVLFDYRPGEWYRPDNGYSAPPLASASPEARSQLRRIADLAVATVSLSPTQRAAVTQRQQELDRLQGAGGR